MNPLLRVSHLSKTFPGVRALDDVSLEVAQGEVVALLGHNGSGKSTLIKVLAGVYRPDSGSTVEVAPGTGMHFIHQDLGLIPSLTALENLDLSRPLGRTGGVRPVNRRAERSRAAALLREFGADFDLTAPVSHLTPAERSIVAIARALDGWSSPHNILVLDEPTAALHGEEVDKLLGVVRRVADAGAGIIYVSHRLDEVLHLADRLVALREGRVVAAGGRGAYDHDDLVTIVAGRVLAQTASARLRLRAAYGDARLVVRDLHTAGVHGLDLTVRAGEIVGVAGLVGSGMERVAGALFGVAPRTGGEVTVDGVAVATRLTPRCHRRRHGPGPRRPARPRGGGHHERPRERHASQDRPSEPEPNSASTTAPSAKRPPGGWSLPRCARIFPSNRSPSSAEATSRRSSWRSGFAWIPPCCCSTNRRRASMSAPRPASTTCSPGRPHKAPPSWSPRRTRRSSSTLCHRVVVLDRGVARLHRPTPRPHRGPVGAGSAQGRLLEPAHRSSDADATARVGAAP